MKFYYRLVYRPASFCTLPRGLQWAYAQRPTSQFDHGIIATDRPLTVAEITAFELAEVRNPAEADQPLTAEEQREEDAFQWASGFDEGGDQ